MSANRFFISLGWSFAAFFVAAFSTGNYVDNLYNARVSAGGDPAFTGLGFEWLQYCAAFACSIFIIGLFGKLPFTR